jgi:hypothetical protein
MRKPKENAVATEFGWVNPDSGELLVSIRGLPNPVKGWKRGEKIQMESVVHDDIDQSTIAPIHNEVKPAVIKQVSSGPKKTSAPVKKEPVEE